MKLLHSRSVFLRRVPSMIAICCFSGVEWKKSHPHNRAFITIVCCGDDEHFFWYYVRLLYSLSRDNLKASAVLMRSTYACSSNRLPVTFRLWFSIANLNADCTSSVPCSNIAPVKIRKIFLNKILLWIPFSLRFWLTVWVKIYIFYNLNWFPMKKEIIFPICRRNRSSPLVWKWKTERDEIFRFNEF